MKNNLYKSWQGSIELFIWPTFSVKVGRLIDQSLVRLIIVLLLLFSLMKLQALWLFQQQKSHSFSDRYLPLLVGS